MFSFDKYQFDYWQDNGSTNPTRAFTMHGNSINNVAINRIVSSVTATAAATASGDSSASARLLNS